MAALLSVPAHAVVVRDCPERLSPQAPVESMTMSRVAVTPDGEEMVLTAGMVDASREWFVVATPSPLDGIDEAYAVALEQNALRRLRRRNINANAVNWLGNQMNLALLAIDWAWSVDKKKTTIYLGWGKYKTWVSFDVDDLDIGLTDIAKAIAGVLGGKKPKKNPVKVKGSMTFVGICYSDDARTKEELRVEVTMKGKISIDPVGDTVELIRGLTED